MDLLAALRCLSLERLAVLHEPETPRYQRAREAIPYLRRVRPVVPRRGTVGVRGSFLLLRRHGGLTGLPIGRRSPVLRQQQGVQP